MEESSLRDSRLRNSAIVERLVSLSGSGSAESTDQYRELRTRLRTWQAAGCVFSPTEVAATVTTS